MYMHSRLSNIMYSCKRYGYLHYCRLDEVGFPRQRERIVSSQIVRGYLPHYGSGDFGFSDSASASCHRK